MVAGLCNLPGKMGSIPGDDKKVSSSSSVNVQLFSVSVRSAFLVRNALKIGQNCCQNFGYF